MHAKKLAFQCRRGMLELDLFLQPFFDNIYPQLTEHERQIFASILSANDQELYGWFINRQPCPYENWQPMIQRIRDYAIQYTYQT